MNHTDIHPEFSLNGISFQKNSLEEFAYDYLKEGQPFETNIGRFLLEWLSQDDFINVKTSGSTGKPKSILLKKQHMINSALATGIYFNIKPKDTALHCLPTEFIAGKMMLVRGMVLGIKLECVQPVSNPLTLTSKKFDFAAMVPLQLENSVEQMSRIKKLIIGGAPISKDLKIAIQGKATEIYETYGMTETITHIAVKQLNSIEDSSLRKKESVFKTLPNIRIKTDSRDCLVIDAPDISDSTVITNDLVKLVSNTEFEWLGRFDSIINSGGIKLIPEQIEQELESIIETPFFVAGLPDATLGQKLVLIVEGEVDENQLIATIKKESKLTKFQIPKMVIGVSKFNRTKNGKLNRAKTLESIKE